MPKTRAEEKVDYGFVKIPKDLIAEVDTIIGKHGFRSRAEFIKEALRRLLMDYEKIKTLPKLEHFNLDEAGVQILDRDLEPPKGRIVQVFFKPDKIFCEIDGEEPCKHKDFALELAEVQEILRKKGWKPK